MEIKKQHSTHNKRDIQLYDAALFLGKELEYIRAEINDCISDLKPRDAITFSVAAANHSLIDAMNRAERRINRHFRTIGHINYSDADKVEFQNGNGQRLTMGEMSESIVDAFPNMIFHVCNKSISSPSNPKTVSLDNAHSLIRLSSLEHCFQRFWKKILWEGYVLHQSKDNFIIQAQDKEMRKLWHAWMRRSQTIQSQNIFDLKCDEENSSHLLDFLPKTVTKIERKPGRSLRYLIGKTRKDDDEKLSFYQAVVSTYISFYVDTPIPSLTQTSLSYGDLIRAWMVFSDIIKLHRYLSRKFQSHFKKCCLYQPNKYQKF
jgi:hypothetical protein